ncbi:pogo transposable element with KRAB domain-like protein, partial [Aphelenchoides avenae]
APDVSWNTPFKAKYRELYDNCMAHGDRQETAGGNQKPPPHEVYLQWIVDAWKSIHREALAASFKTCGITATTDGSEDDLIYCIKPNGPILSRTRRS